MNHYRTVWLSDFHLGTKDCQAEALLDFLRSNDCDQLYLVGDIVDGWALSRSWYWDDHHTNVVQKLLRKSRKGTRVVFIPGNHDAFARDYLSLQLGGIAVLREAVHTTADGRQLLVIHGDEFDGIVRHAPWLSQLGAGAYRIALRFNRTLNGIRRRLGKPYWSLSAYLKLRTKRAVQFVAGFERTVATEAARWNVDGIVCGHIHHAELRMIDGVIYANCGDWVESMTALVEHHDGRLEVLRWQKLARRFESHAGDGLASQIPHLAQPRS